jgi:F-type H+-transporting ATPase subunit b
MTIDWWTFGLQTINILVLLWLLSRFFWRPVAGMIEQRRQTAQSLLDDAQAKRDAAAKYLAEAEKRSAGFADEREEILRQAHAEAAEARRALLARAEAEATALRNASAVARGKERDETEAAWTAQATQLAVEIAGKLAARLDGSSVRAVFLHWLVVQIAALPADSRAAIAASDRIDIVAAAPLGDAEEAEVRAALAAALGADASKLAFGVDAALIAGLELRTPHFVLSNSWRADLAKILAELTHDRPG